MKKLMLLAAILGILCSCTSSSPSPGSVISPITAVGCSIETAVTAGAASGIATALNCTSQAAIQTSLQLALGNVNFCSYQPQADAAKLAKSSKQPLKGVLGDIACPVFINTAMGYLTNSVPAAWGCAAGASASAIAAALTTACETAIPY
jgi:hypothetical protein